MSNEEMNSEQQEDAQRPTHERLVMPTETEMIDFILTTPSGGCESARDIGGYYNETDECGACVYCRIKKIKKA